MTHSPLTTDQTILKVLVRADRDLLVTISTGDVPASIRIMAPVDAVG